MPNETWTVKKVIDWTTEHFKKYCIENPHLEAEILLARAMDVDRIRLYIDFEKEVDKKHLEIFKGFIARKVKGEPAAYITGNKHFMSLNFTVTRDVLIPRPETELLIENAIELSRDSGNDILILDIGTGSGAIAVSLAKFIDRAHIHATDISAKALEVASLNAQKHGVANKVNFMETDLFPKEALKFDIIISNPPYIRTSDIKGLPREIKDFEPLSALDGGIDGLDLYRRIAFSAGNYLKENGSLMLEVGAGQAKDVSELIRSHIKPKGIRIKNDLNGIERVVIAG